ncbi:MULTISPECIES: DUF4175 domain-containing protein [unclassified Sulfitobacter]|jgi:uncharacterized protein (TIGR02302 family)|uniref:DUF4175 domain-containing protein n=1 Tax=unclassified Sulfitobacter TaxID=196795 RepID=UPI0007C2B17E|nr:MULTISPECIES: DUF4175 domain-containing protein [unclassified Sulfitobacter]KZX95990.1 ATPase [Sulfitobacter sp. HI0027]KZX99406.1 ATPase [Sulfitobacter sp. HI0021]KZY99415.1 ATPase [Sulfitobacter sp. HI0076]
METSTDKADGLRVLRGPLRLTWAGMLAEALVQALWPMLALALAVLAALMMGAQDSLAGNLLWAVFAVLGIAFLGTLVFALRRFRVPSRADALARLDASLPGRPIRALLDDQAIGAGDAASAAVWKAHQKRMAARAAAAKPVKGDLRVSRADPYALRYVALLAFVVALVFGSVWRLGEVTQLTPGGAGGALASGLVWEGWAEPPRHTGKPTLYLNDLEAGALSLPAGTLITLRLYGELGALTVAENVSGREGAASSEPAQDFTLRQSGEISIEGPGARAWQITMLPDAAPQIERLGPPEVTALGEMSLPFAARDDYGVEAGEARISLDLASVDRRYGLTIDPDTRPEIVVPLPMPITGDRRDFEESLIENFSKHPWANLPVSLELSVLDAAEQQAVTEVSQLTLPGRRFFDPAAAAVIEMRRDLLWSRANAPRIAQVLRAVTYAPGEDLRSDVTVLRLKQLIRRLEIRARYGLDEEVQAEMAEDMWALAIELEEGVLADALARMRRAQDRLNEAMKNGASSAEIAELMEELRRATEEYLEQLQRQQAQGGEGEGQQPQGESMQMTQDDLQRMMDRIQELMEQGRMAEAAEALRQLQEMMENMRVTQGQPGEGGNSPGEQAMEGLSETLREQQGLSDQAFRDLQEQFNPGTGAGENEGNEGRNGGQGRGQSHEGQQGQGGQSGEEGAEEGLAGRQQALRDELRRQEGRLPGQGTPEGDAARDALDRAGEAMDRAGDALRRDELAEAIDNQAQAMEALREGMRSLGDAMEQEQGEGQPGQGTAEGDRRAEARDPLGREQGGNGANSSDAPLAQGPDDQGRARRLLDEIRRRSGEAERPEVERDYLNRLLDRF